MPLLNRTPARVCIFRMFKAAREGFGRRTLGDMGLGKVKTGVRTSARFCISIFFDQHLIGIQGGGSSARGSGGCGGVRGVHGSLYISLVTSLPARCWLQGGVEGCLHISLLETAGTQQQDDQTSRCPVKVRRHHRLSSPCLYF